MKKLLLTLLILYVAGMTFTVNATQLAGIYTIDSTKAADLTNFKDFSSAITYLTSGNTRSDGGPANVFPFGVIGPVVFEVAASTYMEKLTIPDITGASYDNTITFDGGAGNAATRIITNAVTTTTARATITIKAAKYIRLRNLTIETSGALFGICVNLGGVSAKAIHIKNCILNIAGNGTTSVSGNFFGVAIGNFSVSTFPPTPNVTCYTDSLEIDSNTINYGAVGIGFVGISPNHEGNNRFRSNKIYNAYSIGINAPNQKAVIISDNIISMRTNLSNIGINMFNSTFDGAREGAIISKNKIYNYGMYGIQLATSNGQVGGAKGMIVNNMIGGGTKNPEASCLYFSECSDWIIINNTFNHDIDVIAESNAVIYIASGERFTIVNNIIAETGNGNGLLVYAPKPASIDSIQYNVLYKENRKNTRLMFLAGSYYDQNTLNTLSPVINHNVIRKPLFVNDTNLYIPIACNRGISLPSIITDIDNNIRGGSPVIGAYEAVPTLTNNLSVLEIVSPAGTIAGGPQDLVVKVQNTGTAGISAFDFAYIMNNGTEVRQSWSGTMNPCDIATLTFTGGDQISIDTLVNSIAIYSSKVNGALSVDDDGRDDTLFTTLYKSLNGTYTIGGPGADFATFKEVTDVLETGGVSGPVTFIINPGTYNERVLINGLVTGSSAVNTITFDGVNAAMVTLHTDSFQSTVTLNQAKYIHFRNLTVSNLFADEPTGIRMIGNESNSNGGNNSVKHCNLMIPPFSGQGVHIKGYEELIVIRLDSIEIDSNVFDGGRYGLNIFGGEDLFKHNEHLCVRDNIFQGEMNTGMFITGINSGMEILRNTLSPQTYGIMLLNCKNGWLFTEPFKINGNKIKVSGTGVTISSVAAELTAPTQIYNNEVVIQAAADGLGMEVWTNGVDEIYHNTVYIDSTANISNDGYVFSYQGSEDSKIMNNIFAYAAYTGMDKVYPVNIYSGAAGNNVNHNIYYNGLNEKYLVFRYNVSYGSSNYLTNIGGGDNSYHVKPSFVSNTDLHLTVNCPRGIDLTAFVPEDAEAQLRSLAPSMGAHELIGDSNDIRVSRIVSPVAPVAMGVQDMQVEITNNGGNIIHSFNVSYKISNDPAVKKSWSGSLLPCERVVVTFSGSDQGYLDSNSAVSFYTDLPNGFTDSDLLNDTLGTQVAAPLHGDYTIGASAADFPDILSAVNALMQRGVNDRVTMHLQSGIYNESVSVPDVPGASVSTPVCFQSLDGNRDSVRIEAPMFNPYVLQLMGSNITFRNVSFYQPNNTGANSAVVFEQGVKYDTIDHCNIILPDSLINYADATSGVKANSVLISNIVVSNNYISGGNYGIAFIADLDNPDNRLQGALIENNTIEKNFNTSVVIRNIINLVFNGNKLRSVQSGGLGISCEHCDSSLSITNNIISGIVHSGMGIDIFDCRSTTGQVALISNNVISMRTDTNFTDGYITGVRSNGVYHNYFNNSVYVNCGNSINSGVCAAAHFYNTNYQDQFVSRNNIFFGDGGAPAFAMDEFMLLNAHASDYNYLYSTSNVLVSIANSIFYADLAEWRWTGENDRHSVSYPLTFLEEATLTPDPAFSGSWALNGRGTHLDSTLISSDINGNHRPATREVGLPDLGAYEFTPTALAPLTIAMPDTPAAEDTQVFMSAVSPGDTVASIAWGINSLSMPSSVEVREYVGEKPEGIGATTNYPYFYVSVKGVSLAPYEYNIDVYYTESWLGTLTNETDLRLAKKQQGNPWSLDVSGNNQVNTDNNILTALFQSDTGAVYTATDMNNPLPVKLLDIAAKRTQSDVMLNWSTASELYANRFEIERMINGQHAWKKIGAVKAAGNSNSFKNYGFKDESVSAAAGSTLYYRLKMVDNNGSYTYSKVVSVAIPAGQVPVNVYPNPFNDKVAIEIYAGTVSEVKLILMDITGKVLISQSREAAMGMNRLDLHTDAFPLNAGIYFLAVEIKDASGTARQVKKLVKQ